jgi:anhydro-N-acetylmuramic acid kinase
MSGTSLDGVDTVLADIDERGTKLIACQFTPYAEELRAQILRLQDSFAGDLEASILLGSALSDLYSRCVNSMLSQAKVERSEIAAIGCHGQTIRHRPDRGYTVQLVNGSDLAERTQLNVVCDFRSRDIAAGGQGAPLVPAFHAAVFGKRGTDRVIVNIGGIANITELAADGAVRGFDCGPGNILLDGWVRKHRSLPFDAGGEWARSGKLLPHLLDRWLSHPYFSALPPKSTGRELFNDGWTTDPLGGSAHADDVQRTLLELTARGISDALKRNCAATSAVYLCGGGAHNDFLRERLAALSRNQTLATTSAIGVDPDWVEALAFAWLARQSLLGQTGNLPVVTGARGPRVLGVIHHA